MSDDNDLQKLFGLEDDEASSFKEKLTQMLMRRNLERICNSYVQQEKHEQKRRLDLVIKLAVEGSRVREINRFGSIVVENAVEAVMEGDWGAVLSAIEWTTFKGILVPPDPKGWHPERVEDMREREKELYELWGPFRELLHQAYAGRIEPGQSTGRH